MHQPRKFLKLIVNNDADDDVSDYTCANDDACNYVDASDDASNR